MYRESIYSDILYNIIVNIEHVYTFGYSFMTYIQLTQYLMDMTNRKLARVEHMQESG